VADVKIKGKGTVKQYAVAEDENTEETATEWPVERGKTLSLFYGYI
jgi:hypothetical protein